MERAVLRTAGLVLVISLFVTCRQGGRADLHVAVASSLTVVIDELESRYSARTGTELKVSTGASGNLFAQVASGAPFDLFLSADREYPERMIEEGLAYEDSLTTYCYGIVVIWARSDSGIDPRRLKWDALRHPAARRIAVANPTLAPYGRVALDLLERQEISQEVSARIVVGENVNQAAHFGASGAAQVALIPLSLAQTQSLRQTGSFWEIPETEYASVEQAAVILKAAGDRRANAQKFLDWVIGREAGEIFSAAGFRPVGRGAKGSP